MKSDRWYEVTTLTRFHPVLAGAALSLVWIAVGVAIGRWIWGG